MKESKNLLIILLVFIYTYLTSLETKGCLCATTPNTAFIKGFTLCVSEVNYTNINWLKVPTALFDWGIIFLALRMLKEQGKSLQWGLLLALNPAFWYNTIIWGQFDSIWVFFSLAALYTATRSSWWVSVLLFVLALNTSKWISVAGTASGYVPGSRVFLTLTSTP